MSTVGEFQAQATSGAIAQAKAGISVFPGGKLPGLTRTPAAGSGERWSSEEKFAMVVETAALSEAERGAYCRKRGLYPEHLQAWRRAWKHRQATS